MDFSGKKIFRFLGGNTKNEYSEALGKCMELCPEIKLEDLLPLYFILMTHTTEHFPLPADEKQLCLILSDYFGIGASAAKERLTEQLYPLYGQVEFESAALQKYSSAAKMEILRSILLSVPSDRERGSHTESVMRAAAEKLGLTADEIEEVFLQDDNRRRTRKLMISSGLGLILALVVLLLFVVSAVWLKTVFFGLICAYLCLPLERFFEQYVVDTGFGKWVSRIFMLPFVPALKLRDVLMSRFRKSGTTLKTEAEQKHSENRDLAAKSAALTLVVVTLLLCVLFAGIYYGVRQAAEYIRHSPAVGQTVEKVDDWFVYAEDSLKWKQMDTDGVSLKQTLQAELKEALGNFSPSSITGGDGSPGGVLAIISGLGTFLFDLLMFFFFFFFFLYQMALFRISRRSEGEHSHTPDDIAVWMISKMADSPWVPEISETARDEAKQIIGRVFWMFNSWIRGYCLIIPLEGLLYWTFFRIFNVPFATPLALVASLTVLLPFLGPTISFLLSASVVLLFADSVGIPLIGVIIAYCFINGFLEQIFLYPILVGEAIGLTSLETIIVVLFGGVVAGIPGMIFAVPIAALCKFLIPLAWKVFNPFARAAGETDSSIT